MAKRNIILAFKEKARIQARLRKDRRFINAVAFMKAKGLLDTNLNVGLPAKNILDVNDVIWAGQNLEPRLIEVLPAAILHFPRKFIGLERAPEEFKKIIECIERGEERGPDFAGLEYKKMKFWANTPMKDKRTRPIAERKQSKIFRLHPQTVGKLSELVAAGKFKNQTEAIEAAIKAF